MISTHTGTQRVLAEQVLRLSVCQPHGSDACNESSVLGAGELWKGRPWAYMSTAKPVNLFQLRAFCTQGVLLCR